ncbi:MAG: HNH endonuclease family protein [Clostridiales bacterium]|nr:HNH endonuclease family protein [Clostridiales bacterium]
METLLEDLLRYARLYEKLLTCRSGLNSKKLDDCLYRMMRLEIVVTRPFLMEVLRLNQVGKLTVDDVLSVFLITESYLFRRNICEVPTNALNKIFLNLNREILRYDNTANDYVNKMIYTLRSKKESGRFPDDREFTQALATKQVYQMRGKYKAYLFERFENYGTVETKDVYTHLDNNVYSIEHIMPQHLTPAWTEALGPNYAEIHATWLHRLANLTLTGYNPSLSNNSFSEKRDAKEGGYRASGLKMNQKIARKDSWGLPELEERSAEMTERAKTIWAYPKTDFVPTKKEFDSCENCKCKLNTSAKNF